MCKRRKSRCHDWKAEKSATAQLRWLENRKGRSFSGKPIHVRPLPLRGTRSSWHTIVSSSSARMMAENPGPETQAGIELSGARRATEYRPGTKHSFKDIGMLSPHGGYAGKPPEACGKRICRASISVSVKTSISCCRKSAAVTPAPTCLWPANAPS